MFKIIGLVSIILFFILLPPAVLAVASQDALPGDTLYSIKRGLESGVLAVASLNPSTKAWFSLGYTGRRFNEAARLIDRGEALQAKSSLDDLIDQTTQVVSEIKAVQDQEQKRQLIGELNKSINEYRQGLTQAKQPTQTTTVNPTNPPSSALSGPQPSSTTLSPTPSATPPVYNPPPPSSSLSSIDQDIDETIKELDRIEKELNNRQGRSSMEDEQRNNRDSEERQDRGEMRKRNENNQDQDEHKDED